MMPVPPGVSTAGVGFEQPFDMLVACHERLQRALGLLARLRAHLNVQGCDTQARQAAIDVMRYFDLAAPLHHEDEELHVFPALLAMGDAPLVAAVAQLQADHRHMGLNWAAAREVLARVAAAPESGGPASALFGFFSADEVAVLDRFSSLYAQHMATEENLVYPAARRHQSAKAQAEMTRDMTQRRRSH